jgi:hypothetical protein
MITGMGSSNSIQVSKSNKNTRFLANNWGKTYLKECIRLCDTFKFSVVAPIK